jgi:3alpha(or 20beta)-hydroxysteroid dehydrogenase
MTASMTGRIAIITGGARGMGAATVRAFAGAGATVIIADVLDAEGAALAADVPGSAFHHLDVSSEPAWEAFVATVLASHGRIDALVNNAAILMFKDIDSLTSNDLDRILGINLKGPIFGMKHVGRAMKAAGKGAIVNISSVDGLRGANGLGGYAVTKWGLRGISKTAAIEFGHHGVRVNSIHPGGVNTVMGNPGGATGDALQKDYTMVPLQRIGEPHEIAAASLFLCSDAASYINGAELAVDGGWSAGVYHSMLPGGPAGR